MSDAVGIWNGAMAVVRRDLRVFVSYRARFFTMLLSVFFSLTLFYYISRLVRIEAFPTPDAYYAYVVIGLIILQVLNSTLATPGVSMRQELVAGTFERLVLSPFGPVAGVVATMAFPFVFSLIMGLFMMVFGSVVFGLDIQWATVPLALPIFALGAMAFAPFGLLILASILVFKQSLAGTSWVVAGVSLIAGLYFPVSLLPDGIRWASDVQPFTPALEVLRHLLVDTPLQDPVGVSLAKLVAFPILMFPLALWVVGRAVRTSRRRGTIIEY